MDSFPKCQTCHQHFYIKGPSPYLLPCLHNVCEVCLKQAGGVMSCSICQTEVNLTDTALQKDVVRQREIFHLTVQHRPSELLCTHEDDGNQAVCWCQECEEFLCEHCQNLHENFKANKMHKFKDVSDIKPGVTEEYCSIHKTYPVWFWDKKCNVAICAMCQREDHAIHDVEDIQSFFQTVRNEAKEQKKEILLAVDRFSRLAKEAKDQLRYSEESCGTYTDQINHMTSTMKGHLGQLEKEAIIELEQIAAMRKSEFEAKCKSSETAYQTSKVISEYISKALIYVSNTELTTLKTSLREMTESCRNLPVTELQNDARQRCDDVLDKLKKDISSVVSLKDQGCDTDTTTQATTMSTQKVTQRSEKFSTVKTVIKRMHRDERMVWSVIKYSTLIIFLSILCGTAFQQMMEINHLETSLEKVTFEMEEAIKNHDDIKKTAMLHKQMLSILGILDDVTTQILTIGTANIVLQYTPLEYDLQRVNLQRVYINTDGCLVNQSGTTPVHSQGRFVKYRGTSSSTPVPKAVFPLYWEVRASVRIDKTLSHSASILEIGLCREDDRDMSYRIHSRPYTYSLSVYYSYRLVSVCRGTWKDGYSVDVHPDTLPNTSGSQDQLHYGVLFDASRSKIAFIDLNEHNILSVFDDIDSSKPLWPMFGVYNRHLVSVEMKLIVGKDIEMSEKKKSLIIKAFS